LTGINGANPQGLFSNLQYPKPDFTPFNGEVVFEGNDVAGNLGLWVTDGTSSGTHEVTGINGAYVGGILASTFALPLSPDLTAFGSQVLFEGANQAGNYGLWTTNGTAAGTHELTGIAGASSHGIFSFVFSPDFTVFNSVITISFDGGPGTTFNKSQVLFDGTDAAGNDNLWVTDGTAAGTREMTGISGAHPLGLFYQVDNPDFTVFNGQVLFDGTNVVGNNGLWVTNGTLGGTHEVTGINGASPNGIFYLVNNPNFTSLNNGEVLFEGTNAAGHNGLWVTDGTAAGTHELTGISGASNGGINPYDLTFKGAAISFIEHVPIIGTSGSLIEHLV
jgi:ELWxxDGT repeat protein